MTAIPRRTLYCLAVAMLVAGLLSTLRFNILQVGATFDDAHYVVLAESLGTGRGYNLINFPIPSADTQFPPGWPLLLAPVAALFPANYTVLKLVSLLLWLCSIPLAYILLGRRLRSPYSELFVAVVATNASLVAAGTMVMAEAAYVFFSLLTLCLAGYWLEGHRRPTTPTLIGLAALAAYAQTVRTIGLAVIVAILAWLLIRGQWRFAIAFAATAVIGMVPQILLNRRTGGLLLSRQYLKFSFGASDLYDKIPQAARQAYAYFDGAIVNSIFPVFDEPYVRLLAGLGLVILLTLVNIVFVMIMLAGFFRSARRLNIIDLYVVSYFGGLLTFRAPSFGIIQPRFMIPLIPFFVYYLILGVRWLISLIPRADERWARTIVVSVVVATIAVALVDNARSWRNPVRNRTTDLAIGSIWLRENAASDAIVMTPDPTMRYLYARRRTIEYPDPQQDLTTFLRDSGVDYILVAPKLQSPRTVRLDKQVTVVVPYLRSHRDTFVEVFSNTEHNVAIYKVLR